MRFPAVKARVPGRANRRAYGPGTRAVRRRGAGAKTRVEPVTVISGAEVVCGMVQGSGSRCPGVQHLFRSHSRVPVVSLLG